MGKVILAIVSISILEAIALITGVDGAIFALVIAAISGLGGYELRGIKK